MERLHNGLEAMELIQTQEPDLIILDLVMPNLDGLGVLERINARTTITRPKIIMLDSFWAGIFDASGYDARCGLLYFKTFRS